MKTLVIPDIHWLDFWEQFVEEEEYDNIVFLWDYVDSFNIPPERILKNLENIIEYKKNNPKKVTLLLWNHDVQYMWEEYKCSGYNKNMAMSYWILFKENLNLFELFTNIWGYFFSHAWISDWFLSEVLSNSKLYITSISALESKENRDFFFRVWSMRWGFHRYGWPIWADKSEVMNSNKLWAIQVIGHTRVNEIERYWDNIFCDTWENCADRGVVPEKFVIEY